MSEPILQAPNFCAYGCGQEAKYTLRKGIGWKFCCSPHYQQCPAQRKRRGAITRDAYVKQKLNGTIFRRGLLREAKREAKRQSTSWTITDAHFYDLIQGLCYYCGHHPTSLQTPNKVTRFDTGGGFTPQNTIPCCSTCFKLTSSFAPEVFWNYVKRVLDRHPNGIVHPSKAIITKSA